MHNFFCSCHLIIQALLRSVLVMRVGSDSMPHPLPHLLAALTATQAAVPVGKWRMVIRLKMVRLSVCTMCT